MKKYASIIYIILFLVGCKKEVEVTKQIPIPVVDPRDIWVGTWKREFKIEKIKKTYIENLTVSKSNEDKSFLVVKFDNGVKGDLSAQVSGSNITLSRRNSSGNIGTINYYQYEYDCDGQISKDGKSINLKGSASGFDNSSSIDGLFSSDITEVWTKN